MYPASFLAICKVMLRLFCALSAFAYISYASANTEAPDVNTDAPLNIRVWTSDDGLPHNSVNRITQDRLGYLWIATWEGPVRFNGREFEVFDDRRQSGLPDNGMLEVIRAPDASQVLFGGARGGIARTDANDWQTFDTVPPRVHRLFVDANEDLWIGTFNAGLVKQKASGERQTYSTEHGLPGRSVHSLLMTKAGYLWVGTNNGVAQLASDGNSFTPLTQLPDNTVLTMLQLTDGRILVAIDNKLYIANDSQQPRFEVFPTPLRSAINVLHQDMAGNIWAGTHKNGIAKVSLQEQTLEYIDSTHGLPNDHVLDIFCDREGSLWVGTHGGLVQLRSTLFTTYTEADGLPANYIRALHQLRDGTLLVGGLGGLSQYQNHHFSPIATVPELHNKSILSINSDEFDRIYVGTFTDGLYVVENQELLKRLDKADGMVSNEIRAILPLSKYELLIGTVSGLHRIDFSQDQLQLQTFTTDDGLPHDYVASLYRDSLGTIWLGTLTGLAQFELKSNTIKPYDFAAGNDAQYIFNIYEDASHLWLGTDRGLMARDQSTGEWTVISRANGLPFDNYFGITRDNSGNIWGGNSRGVLRLPQRQVDAVLAGTQTQVSYRLFKKADGLQTAQMNTGDQAIIKSQSGEIWFALSSGVASTTPVEVGHNNSVPPNVDIHRVAADNQPIAPGAELDAKVNRVSFSYAALGYLNSESIRYQVQLRGFDKNWVDRGNVMSVDYTDLAPRHYQFAVRAAYPRGEWSQIATVDIYQRPELWQRWWIQLLGLLIIVLTIAGLVRLRLRGLAKSRQRLLTLVNEQTKELEALANQDSLTQLANRRAFDRFIQRALLRSEKLDQPLCLAILDIDNFKDVNDTYFHASGDEILKRLADIIRDCIRDNDHAARWGGEEFALLLDNTNIDTAFKICERIRSRVAEARFEDIDTKLTVTLSAGIAQHHTNESHSSLLLRADKALYSAKHDGRNQVVIADDDR
ncbi:diguanylate cyclase (GGDEF) domain-containing protein [Pseudidiomarina planktonica]|uniref:diguanylate cyclase n=2 Tax=Pseudidiomarina planktonica TaxID=1323738 RepID=A0A1Y6EUX8_9GAMM|nr:diguanylate cyclase (GGDEF) domain-containing protein [Pseudidiomarina planktonica]